jgi:hypothetical protein
MTGDGGGWTLVMKLDGAQATFVYGSPLWTNDETLNPGSPDLDTTEAKLASFSRMPVTALRLGMRMGNDTRWVNFVHAATSLRSLFEGGYVATTVGRQGWLSLLATPSLQDNCNLEGFNVVGTMGPTYSTVRIGILGNQEPDCATPDSRMGFGGGAGLCGEDPNNSCGNELGCNPNGPVSTKAFGYVMLR